MTGARPLSSLFTLVLSIALLALAGHAQAAQMVSIDRPEANMRAGAGTRHPTLWTLSKGYPLRVIARKGQWYQVRDFEDDRGWVHRSLTGTTPHHVVKTKVANLRAGPGTGHRVVGKAEYGEVLRTLGRHGDWVRVRDHAGRTGWLARRLVWGW